MKKAAVTRATYINDASHFTSLLFLGECTKTITWANVDFVTIQT